MRGRAEKAGDDGGADDPRGSWSAVASHVPVRLRLVVAIPAAVTFFSLAAGIGGLNLLLALDPQLAPSSEARLWATVGVVGFSVFAGGAGYLLARQLRRPLRRLIRELRHRAPEEGRDVRHTGPVSPDELQLAQRTVGEYLQVLDEYRLDASLLEEMQEAVLVLDADARILHGNRQAADLVRRETRDLLGRRLGDVLPGGAGNLSLRSFVRRGLAAAKQGEMAGRGSALWEDLTLENEDGEEISVRARVFYTSEGFQVESSRGGRWRPRSWASGEPRLILTLSDLSQQEARRKQQERQQRLAALGTLVAEVAHEVRNPLGSLRSLVELLGKKLPEEDPRREHLDSIAGRIAGVVGYLDDVLDYSQPRQLDLGEVEIRPLLQEAVETVRPRAAERSLDLTWTAGGNVEALPRADRERLFQVLTNLLGNAVEHAEDEGRVELRSRALDREGARTVVLTVFNTGSFIPEERREEIFEPFVGSRPDSTGLGLTVSRYLVRLHGGDIEVESREEEGTAFHVHLPAQRETGSAA